MRPDIVRLGLSKHVYLSALERRPTTLVGGSNSRLLATGQCPLDAHRVILLSSHHVCLDASPAVSTRQVGNCAVWLNVVTALLYTKRSKRTRECDSLQNEIMSGPLPSCHLSLFLLSRAPPKPAALYGTVVG